MAKAIWSPTSQYSPWLSAIILWKFSGVQELNLQAEAYPAGVARYLLDIQWFWFLLELVYDSIRAAVAKQIDNFVFPFSETLLVLLG